MAYTIDLQPPIQKCKICKSFFFPSPSSHQNTKITKHIKTRTSGIDLVGIQDPISIHIPYSVSQQKYANKSVKRPLTWVIDNGSHPTLFLSEKPTGSVASQHRILSLPSWLVQIAMIGWSFQCPMTRRVKSPIQHGIFEHCSLIHIFLPNFPSPFTTIRYSPSYDSPWKKSIAIFIQNPHPMVGPSSGDPGAASSCWRGSSLRKASTRPSMLMSSVSCKSSEARLDRS